MFKDLIEFIAQSLVDHPERVKVHEVEREKVTVLELSVAADDLGKIIGKGGRTAKAIRAVLLAAGVKVNRKTVLEIIESD